MTDPVLAAITERAREVRELLATLPEPLNTSEAWDSVDFLLARVGELEARIQHRREHRREHLTAWLLDRFGIEPGVYDEEGLEPVATIEQLVEGGG